MPKLTDERIAELRRLCEKATPGPWGFDLNRYIASFDDEGEWGLTVVMLPAPPETTKKEQP